MGNDATAIIKLTTVDPFGAPGCMLGYHGRIRSSWQRDPDLQLALDDALALCDLRLAALASQIPGLPPSMAPFSFAVVDLTEDSLGGFGLERPAYAGHNDTRSMGSASLAKLLALYGAYQLRSDLRSLAAGSPASSLAELAALLREHHRHLGASDGVYPLVEDLFTLSGGRVDFTTGVDFTTATLPTRASEHIQSGTDFVLDLTLTKIDIDDHHNKDPTSRPATIRGKLGDQAPAAVKLAALRAQLAQVGFREQLRLMVGWSNNASASIVIQALGFRYLWTLGTRSGLYRSEGWERSSEPHAGTREHAPGGLFLGRDYAGNMWKDRSRGTAASPQAASAQAIATLLSALAQERLVEPEAHLEMREMLRMTNQNFTTGVGSTVIDPYNHLLRRGEDCPIGEGLAAAPASWVAAQQAWRYGPLPADPFDATVQALRDGPLAVSKIGLLDLRTVDDPEGYCMAGNALLVRSRRSYQSPARTVPVTAVLVSMVDVPGVDPKVLYVVNAVFGAAMATLLDERHGA